MSKRIIFWAIWLLFIVYATIFAPPDQSNSLALITQLSTGKWQDINPYVVALFNIMGVWPILYGSVMLTDGQRQTVRAWPFLVGSFAVGAFAILPYLALRTPNLNHPIQQSWILAIANSRWLGVIVFASVLGLLGYAITQGSWADFIQQWQSSRFIHVMSLDFCLLCLLFPTLLKDDWASRGLERSWLYWLVLFTPLIGPACYLVFRPPLVAPPNNVTVSGDTTPEFH